MRDAYDEDTAYRRLASAIVLQAVKDYRDAIECLWKNPKDMTAKVMAEECKTFFGSDWCYALSGMDADYLLGKLSDDTTKPVRHARHNTKGS